MIEVNSTISEIVGSYNSILTTFPQWAQSFLNLFLVLIVVLFYLFFVNKFYNSVSKKDLLKLNLNQYNKSEVPIIYKIYKSSLYLVEYIVILPFITFFWFSALSLFLLILTDIQLSNILLISAVIVIAARMASYYNEELSQNIAKLIPFTLLAIALLTPNFFKFESIMIHFQQLPSFFSQILI